MPKVANKKFYLQRFLKHLHLAYYWIRRPVTKGVKGLIFHDSKILMVRLTYYPHTWTFPGGMVDNHEEPKDAVVREVKEEVAIDLRNPTFVSSLYLEQQFKKDTVYIYTEEIPTADFQVDGFEVAEAAWFSLNKLPPMGKNTKKILSILVGAN